MMMPSARPRVLSMRLLISLSTAALLILTMVAVYGVTERHARRAMRQELETRLLLEARHLALLSTDALLSEFPELTLCPIVTSLLETRSDLEFAVVLDHDGIIQGHAEIRRLGEPLSELEDLETYPALVDLEAGESLLADEHRVAARVPSRHVGGQTVGSVVVAKDLAHITAALQASRRQIALLASGLALVGTMAAFILTQRLLAPLDAIRQGLARIGGGDLDTRIPVQSRTELGLLADAINTMTHHLKRIRAIARAREAEVINTQREVIHTLGEVVENRSRETGGHIDRVALGSALLGKLAGLSARQCELLRMAAPMHDVGKIAIPDAILNKPGKLTDEEMDVMKQHAEIGAHILSQSSRPIFRAAAIIAAEHHEHWDGAGYPAGLAGEDIHVYGRIVAIVDCFDALTSDRCYRKAMPLAKALDIMRSERGTHFDPELFDLFLANIDEFVALCETTVPLRGDGELARADGALSETEPVGVPG
ncbi:HD domain-containing protein [bacterium]|nr:HD domain-containing protein [bacterium]